MKQVATVVFRDMDSLEDSFAIVRAASGVVGLTLSQRNNGDVETFFPVASAKVLISALQEALSLANVPD